MAPPIRFRVTPQERAQIEAAAQRAGYTVSSYARMRALTKTQTRSVRKPPVESAQLAQLLGMHGTAGGALQRLAQMAPEEVTRSELQAAIADFRKVADAIMRALGKRPLTLSVQPSSVRLQ